MADVPPIETWPKEVLDRAREYGGKHFAEARIVQHELVSAWSDQQWTIPEFKALLDAIPAEYAETGVVEFKIGSYDGGDHFEAYYLAPETAETVADQVQRCYAYAIAVIDKERLDYERLKRKFEGGT